MMMLKSVLGQNDNYTVRVSKHKRDTNGDILLVSPFFMPVSGVIFKFFKKVGGENGEMFINEIFHVIIQLVIKRITVHKDREVNKYDRYKRVCLLSFE